MYSVAFLNMEEPESKKSWINLEIGTFWKVGILTPVSTIYLGVAVIAGSVIGMTYIASMFNGKELLISSKDLVELIEIYLGFLPYVLGYEGFVRVLEIFKPNSKKINK